jgi:broad specificity phosphatase PhoE
MSIYLVVAPPNKLEEKNRVGGWRNVPWTREAKKQLHAMAADLKGKAVKYVAGSDLDSEAGNLLASELNVPFREDFRLRRFNCGRHHAAKSDHFADVLERLFGQWSANPDIPVRGGDSLTSLNKRLLKTARAILASEDEIAFVTDSRTASFVIYGTPKSLNMNGGGLKAGKIYVLKGKNADTDKSMERAAS